MISIKLTVLFDNPFWIGVFEKLEGMTYTVCKVTFGAEPKDDELMEFITANFYNLKFSNKFHDEKQILSSIKKINPKRIQRSIKKETQTNGIGTKAQIAIKLQQEENKIARKKKSKAINEEKEKRKFQLKQEKRLKKHKGH